MQTSDSSDGNYILPPAKVGGSKPCVVILLIFYMYKAALDVHYRNNTAVAVCILFENWSDTKARHIYSKEIKEVQEYE